MYDLALCEQAKVVIGLSINGASGSIRRLSIEMYL